MQAGMQDFCGSLSAAVQQSHIPSARRPACYGETTFQGVWRVWQEGKTSQISIPWLSVFLSGKSRVVRRNTHFLSPDPTKPECVLHLQKRNLTKYTQLSFPLHRIWIAPEVGFNILLYISFLIMYKRNWCMIVARRLVQWKAQKFHYSRTSRGLKAFWVLQSYNRKCSCVHSPLWTQWHLDTVWNTTIFWIRTLQQIHTKYGDAQMEVEPWVRSLVCAT